VPESYYRGSQKGFKFLLGWWEFCPIGRGHDCKSSFIRSFFGGCGK
jgi:hypothetical protein